MINKDLTKTFDDEIYSKAPKKNYPTNKKSIITSMKYGVSISLIRLTIKYQITRVIDTYSS